ncbi:MAG: helix-turn-helix transcriptional regulator [Bacteriovoracaceae bacterium]|nr:helix-turn-helix transcriptional regulator [Bacteriovoracaceae bacterium]
MNELRKLRLKKKYTQRQVAIIAGITQGTYSRIENAKLELTAIQWIKICKFLNIDPMIILKFKKKV